MDFTKAEVKQRFKEEVYENQICSEVGQVLEKHYPKWSWWVECKLPTGLFAIRCLDLDGDYGFYMPLTNYLANPDRHKMVMRAGGELLERYRQDRGVKPDKIEVERDIKGNATGDKDAASR